MRVRTALLGHGGPPEESIPRDLSVGVQALIRSAASSRHGDYRQPTPSHPGRRVRVVHGGVAEEDDTRGLEIRHGRAVFFRETEPLARLRSDLTSDYPRDYTVAQSVVDSYCGGDGSGRNRRPHPLFLLIPRSSRRRSCARILVTDLEVCKGRTAWDLSSCASPSSASPRVGTRVALLRVTRRDARQC